MNKFYLWTSIAIVCASAGCASAPDEDVEAAGSTSAAIEASSCGAWLSGITETYESKADRPAGSIAADLMVGSRAIGTLQAEYVNDADSPYAGTISGTFSAYETSGRVEGWYQPASDMSAELQLVFSDPSGMRWEGLATSNYVEAANGPALAPYLEGLALCEAAKAAPPAAMPVADAAEESSDTPATAGPGSGNEDQQVVDAIGEKGVAAQRERD